MRTAIKTKRIFVVDVYTAFVMHLISRETKIPIPGVDEKLRIVFPRLLCDNESKRKILTEKLPQFLAKQIEIEEIRLHPENFLMVFRASMLETDFAGRLPQGTLCLHSRWEGYLEQPDALEVKRAIENANGQLIQSHISGHLRQDDIIALIKQSKPHAIVPIHTFSPQLLSDQFTNVRLLVDGESFDTF
jgi:ribonuclease J